MLGFAAANGLDGRPLRLTCRGRRDDPVKDWYMSRFCVLTREPYGEEQRGRGIKHGGVHGMVVVVSKQVMDGLEVAPLTLSGQATAAHQNFPSRQGRRTQETKRLKLSFRTSSRPHFIISPRKNLHVAYIALASRPLKCSDDQYRHHRCDTTRIDSTKERPSQIAPCDASGPYASQLKTDERLANNDCFPARDSCSLKASCRT